MKIHQNIIRSVQEALIRIFQEGYHADDVVRTVLQSNPKWGSRDRRFIAQAIYTVVRWWRRYLFMADVSENDPDCFQKVVAAYLYEQYQDTQWMSMSTEEWNVRMAHAESIRAVSNSIPDWMDQQGVIELGEDKWSQELFFLNKEADVYLRVNTLKKNPQQLLQDLATEGVEAEPYGALEETLRLKERKPLQRLTSYLNGGYEIQDAGSQLIAHFLKPEKGKVVIDACAGAGGKSLHIAALMRNTGRVIAMDVEAPKLKELKRRADRAGAGILETKLIETGTVQSLHSTADYLLLDVPCSGIGVLRRNPDDKWKLSSGKIQQLQKVQQTIIDEYSTMLKPGGIMVYATCSIFRTENEKQIETFLSAHPDFSLERMQTIYPSEGGDGFFMARLVRLM